MTKGRSITIGGITFETTGAAGMFCSAMIDRYASNQTLVVEDAYFVRDLLLLHPDSSGKIGDGVHHFEVRLNRYAAKSLYVVRIDGSIEDFSYKKCLAGQGSAPAGHNTTF